MFDREAILAAVDLPALADEFLGDRSGTPRTPTWPCPEQQHAQTGRTPPVTVFTARDGLPRWHCHGCGNGGTAIDLVMQVRGINVRDAMAELTSRYGVPELSDGTRRRPSRGSKDPVRSKLEYVAPVAVPQIERYVAECADALWTPAGTGVRQWLTRCRGLPEEVLRVNRIGADLGSRRQARPTGLPAVHQAVVLPVLVDGQACYVQLRTLGARRGVPRYMNPSDTLARNPRLGYFRPCRTRADPKWRKEVIVTEGIIDALSAAAAGYRAAAILGAGCTNQVTAMALSRVDASLVIAFDADGAGKAGASRLSALLRAHNRDAQVLRLSHGDLNERLVASGDWPLEMQARVEHATFMRSARPLGREVG